MSNVTDVRKSMASGSVADSSGRPGQIRKKPAIRSEEILCVSCKVFRTHGYAAFNLRRVASAVGIRLGTLQYYFPTRERLLDATLERIIHSIMQQFESVAADLRLPPARRLQQLCDLHVEIFDSEKTGPVLLEILALAQHQPIVQAILARNDSLYRSIFERVLRASAPDCPEAIIDTASTFITSQLQA